MVLSRVLYLALLAAVSASRFVEVGISRRHRADLRARGARPASDPVFPWMVLLHAATILGAGVEVAAARRPFVPALAAPMLLLVALATLLRWWVIRTLGAHWNVHVMDSLGLGVVSDGPYRWIRHPNYLAVIVELAALPLVHTAWITAIASGAAHAWVLRRRIAAEEAVLHVDPAYRARMGHKPRFLPRWARPPFTTRRGPAAPRPR
jgi:methyltransferase